jgi:DNA repair exonuclease SbcCD ATPase subunit
VLTSAQQRFPFLELEFSKYVESSKESLSAVLGKLTEKYELRGERVSDESTKNRIVVDLELLSGNDLDRELDELTRQLAKAEAELKEEEESQQRELKNAQSALYIQKGECETSKEKLGKAKEQFSEQAQAPELVAELESLQDELTTAFATSKTESILAQHLEEDEIELANKKEAHQKSIEKLKVQLKDAASALEKAANEIKSIVTTQFFDQEQEKTEIKALKDQATTLISASRHAQETALGKHWLAFELLNDNKIIDVQADFLKQRIDTLEQVLHEEENRVAPDEFSESSPSVPQAELSSLLTAITFF